MSPEEIAASAGIVNQLNLTSLLGVVWPILILIGYHLYKKYQTKKVMNGYASKTGVTLDGLHEAMGEWGKGLISDRSDSKKFRQGVREDLKKLVDRMGVVEGDNKAQSESIDLLKKIVIKT